MYQLKNNKIHVRYGVDVINFFIILIIELRDRRRKKKGEETREERRREKEELCFHYEHGSCVTKLDEQCLVVPTRCWPSGSCPPLGFLYHTSHALPKGMSPTAGLCCQQAWPSQGFLHTPSILSPPLYPGCPSYFSLCHVQKTDPSQPFSVDISQISPMASPICTPPP